HRDPDARERARDQDRRERDIAEHAPARRGRRVRRRGRWAAQGVGRILTSSLIPAPDPQGSQRLRRRCGAEFPANREKSSEFRPFRPIFGKSVSESPTIPSGSEKIPYAGEQGIKSAHHRIKVPCSAENRDIARLMPPLPAAPPCVMERIANQRPPR